VLIVRFLNERRRPPLAVIGGWGAGFALLWIIAAELAWLIGEARREDKPMTKAAMRCGNPP